MHIVHTEASLGWGGQELRILSEAEGMRERGHSVTLLAPEESRIYREAQVRGLPSVALPIGKRNFAALRSLRAWLTAHPVDVLNTHSSTDTWLCAVAALTLPDAPPLVRTRHISAPVARNLFSRWLYQKATAHIVTTGERLRETLIETNGYDARTITSVPTGIDTTRFCPGDRAAARADLGLDRDAFIVGIVATLRSWKGHRYLIDAVAALDDKTRLLIVGDGPQRDALASQLRERGLEARALMPGNQTNVVPWLRAADVFALPSYANEGVPQALMQAMACALPVVSTPVGSITELVHNGETGLIVAPEQVPPLREALARLRDDPALRARLGAAARAHVERHHGRERMLDDMEVIFRKVVGAQQPMVARSPNP